jgi:MFS family permease
LRTKSIIISSLGSAFETFDFHIFGLFAFQISMSLLHKESFNGSLILIFAIFGVGYFARPLGAMFWGNIGDKYGRKIPFKWTVALIGIASLVISVLPSTETLGILTPIILAVCRLVQGFSFGGELTAAVLLVYEQKSARRSFLTSIVIFCATSGMILGSIAYYLLSLFLTTEQFFEYSWRLAFAFGGIAVLLSYFWRSSIKETLVIQEATNKTRGFVLSELLKNHLGLLIRCILSVASCTIFLAMFVIFFPTFCQKILEFNKDETSLYVLLTIVTYALSVLAGGYIADRIGNRATQALGIILAVILLIPLALALLAKSTIALFLIIPFAFVNGLINANYMCVVLNRFTEQQRFSGLAITQNLAMALFTGALPILFAYLTVDLKLISAPFYILIVFYIISLVSLFEK